MVMFVYTIEVHTIKSKLRNVTLSARGDLIDQARKAANARGQTLNDAFRSWLESFTRRGSAEADPYEAFVASLGGVTMGSMPDRDERNRRNG